MTHKTLSAALSGRGALIVAALALLAIAAVSVASIAYAQSPPPAPTGLTASASSGGITLSWTAPGESGVTGYQILRRLSADGWVWSEAVYVDDTGDTTTSYTDTGVQAGKEYHYRVKARYGSKIGRWSNGVNVRAAGDAPPPTPEPSFSDDAALSRLELSGISFAFDPATYSYDVDVAHEVEQTTVTATVNDDGATYVIKLGTVADADGTVDLAVGANAVSVVVTAEDGNATKTYTVTVTRTAPSDDAMLSSLTLSSIDIGNFDSDTTNYTASVGNDVTETTVTATANDDGATYVVKLDGSKDADGTVDLAVGSNALSIVVTAEDGNANRTYTITVTRAAAPEPALSVEVELSPSGPVAPGTAITVTMSFGGLAEDSDQATTDYIFRADVKNPENEDADACEDQAGGYGLGADRYMKKVDQDPEVRKGKVSADCPAGDYTLEASISDADNNQLASASAAFTVEEPLPPAIAVALNPSGEVEEGTEIAVAISFGNLKPDSDSSTVDYVFRADVKDSDNGDADGCEGDGMGADRNINEVDQDPETRTGDVSADCPAGDYKVEVAISDAGNNRLASARVNFTIAEPESSKEKATRGEDEPRVARQTACDAIWCATLTVDEQTGSFGWSSGPEFAQASLTDDRFNFAGNEYQLDEIAFRDSDNRLTLSFSGFNAGDIDSQATRIRLAVDIDGAVLNLGEGTYNNSVSKTISWTQDVGWSDGQTVQLKIVEVLGPILSISPSASPIKEARNAKATFTVTRSHLTSGYTTAHLGWSRTGNYFNCDYCGPATDEARQNEGELPLSPVFRPGETTRTVSFRVHEDYEFEQPGSVTLFLKPTTLPDNEYEIDPAGQSATVEVHSHGERGGPLSTFGDRWPPILAHMEVPPVPEKDGRYRVYVHLRMAPSVSFAGRTYTARIAHMGEDMPTVPSFSFTVSTRQQTAEPPDKLAPNDPYDYSALSHAVLFQSRECSPPTVVNDCWRWDGATWRNTHAVDVTTAITGINDPPIVSDDIWENHEYFDIRIERSPGLYGSIRFDESIPRQLPLWIMDTGPAGDPGLTADWTPTGVDLAWDDAIWSATMQVGYTRDAGAGADVYGWDAGSLIPDDSLSDMHFDHEGQTYEVDLVTAMTVPGATTLVLAFDDSQHGDIASQSTRNNLDLHVGDQVFNLGAALYEDRTKSVQWGDVVLTAWAAGDTVPLKITRADSTLYNPPAGSEWQFTVWRRNLSESQSAPYELVAGSIGFKATTDSTPEVDGIGDLNLVEYVVEGIAYAGGTKVALWASTKRLFRPHHVRDAARNTDEASRSGVVAPGHPTGLTAEVDSQNFVTLEWDKPAQGPVTDYKICRTDVANAADPTNNDNCENAITVSATDPTTHRHLPGAVALHEYRIIAVNAPRGHTVEGGSSNAVRVNRRISTFKPSSPRDVTASWAKDSSGDYSVTLNWSQSDDANSYIVRRCLYSESHGAIQGYDEQGRPISGCPREYTVSGGSTTTYTDTQDLLAGKRYQYRVYAKNSGGTSEPSPYIRVGLYDLDSSESWLTAKTQSAPNAVQLEWNVPSSDGTYDSFQVWRRALKGDDNEWKMLVVDTGSSTTTYTDSDVDAGAEYEYRVFAANGTRHWTSPAASAEIIRD